MAFSSHANTAATHPPTTFEFLSTENDHFTAGITSAQEDFDRTGWLNPAFYTQPFFNQTLPRHPDSFESHLHNGFGVRQAHSSELQSMLPPHPDCIDYMCCGSKMTDLHALVEHFEECHVVVVDPYDHRSISQPGSSAAAGSSSQSSWPQDYFAPDDMELDTDDASVSSRGAFSHIHVPISTPNSSHSTAALYPGSLPLAYPSPRTASIPVFDTPTVLPFPRHSPFTAESPRSRRTSNSLTEQTFYTYSGYSEDSLPLHNQSPSSTLYSTLTTDSLAIIDTDNSHEKGSTNAPPALLLNTSANNLADCPPAIFRVASPAPGLTVVRNVARALASTSASDTTANVVHASTTLPRPVTSLLLSKPFWCPKPSCNKSYKKASDLKHHMTHGVCGVGMPEDLEPLQIPLSQTFRQLILATFDTIQTKEIDSYLWTPSNISDDMRTTMTAAMAIVADQNGRRWMKSLKGDDAASCIEFLDQIIEHIQDGERQSSVFQVLATLCKQERLLPQSCMIPNLAVTRSGNHAVARGRFADIWRGQYGNQHVALKIFPPPQGDNVQAFRKIFTREVIHWKKLHHPNILPFLGVIDDASFGLCMVSPWMNNGNVGKYLEQNPSANRLLLLRNIASGLVYLHFMHIIHGDLKGANILVDNTGQACLADFGLAAVKHGIATPPTTSTTHSGRGTTRWMAPELFDPERFGRDSCRHTEESDIYALGMVMLEIFTGRIPFYDIAMEARVIYSVTSGRRPERPMAATAFGLSDRIWSLMESCWSEKYLERPNATTVLRVLSEASVI